jgi:hypothetical protein
MAIIKHLTDISYNHRRDYFLNNGASIIENFSKTLREKYPEIYKSSSPSKKDFPDLDLFAFVERIVFENLNSDYNVNQDSDLINNTLKYYSSEQQLNIIRKNECFKSIYSFPIYPTDIPPQIRELLGENLEILEEYYKASIESHLKKFFIRGHINEFWLNLDQLYRYGFNRFINQFNKFKTVQLEFIDNELNNYTENSIYGLLKGADLHTKYQNLKGNELNVQLLKFRFNNSPTNEPICYNHFVRSLKMNPMEYLINKEHLDDYIQASFDPINKVRELLNLPKLGEGWISETKLYYQLKKHFNEHVVLQHLKPKWLGRQHFDIYFPNLNIAIEYQGRQHFEAIEYFGGESAFKKNQERDNRKRKLSIENCCDLIYVESGYIFSEVIEEITKSKNFMKNNILH